MFIFLKNIVKNNRFGNITLLLIFNCLAIIETKTNSSPEKLILHAIKNIENNHAVKLLT